MYPFTVPIHCIFPCFIVLMAWCWCFAHGTCVSFSYGISVCTEVVVVYKRLCALILIEIVVEVDVVPYMDEWEVVVLAWIVGSTALEEFDW